MNETLKTNDLKVTYLCSSSHTNAGYFFGDDQTEVTNKIGRFVLLEHAVARDRNKKT
jgi:hypothetical protein